jgi:hypothetical protein
MFDALPVARIAAIGHADPARGVVERVLQVRLRVRGPPNDETDVIAQGPVARSGSVRKGLDLEAQPRHVRAAEPDISCAAA